ncbi:hypothetical protein JTB14_013322 [Gonioctena quinquepunctata]|nr:hypothetical protein JTB14_013322 [Gonioctena quinquepunctata]
MATRALCLLLIIFFVEKSNQSLQDDISREMNNTNRAIESLSRRKRYLTFPAGSSLQLVYCLTVPSVGVGEIFTFGATAALAWELPTEVDQLLFKKTTTTEAPTTTMPPHHYVEYDHPPEDHHSERIDEPSNYLSGGWTEENGGYPGPVRSYYDPFLMKKSSTYGSSPARNPGKSQYPISQFGDRRSSYYDGNRYPNSRYDDSNEVEPVTYYIHPVYHEIHRRTRRDLYGKIQTLLTALSKDGRACLMKAICEVSQVPEGKGTLMEEILKAVFRIKPHENYPDEDDYDKAANKGHDCKEQYPSCENSIWTNMF